MDQKVLVNKSTKIIPYAGQEIPVGASVWNCENLYQLMRNNDFNSNWHNLKMNELPSEALMIERYNLLSELWDMTQIIITDSSVCTYKDCKVFHLENNEVENPNKLTNNIIAVSQKYPLMFVHIPKAAGSSINAVLDIKTTRQHLSLH